MNAASLPVLWANCVERLKDRVNNRSFWEAVEAVHPITIEDDTLVLGLDAFNSQLSSHIHHAAHMNAVRKAVEEVFNQPLEVRLIEGTVLADWETAKARDARVAAMRQASEEQGAAKAPTTESWESVTEQMARLYQRTPFKSLPQGKARYANEALYELVEAMDGLYPDPADEAAERSLGRALDRISSASDIPAPVLAFELERLRAWRRTEEAGEGG